MDSFTKKRVVLRRYYFRGLLVSLLYLAIAVPLLIIYHNIWAFILCFLLYFIMVIPLVRIISKKIIGSVLFNELDAQTFQEIMNDKHLLPHLGYRIGGALSIGDYQTVVNNVEFKMRNKRCSLRQQLSYLSLLSRVYFELRDFEKLKDLYGKYNTLKDLHSEEAVFQSQNPVWTYYESFLKREYETCKALCKVPLNMKAWGSKYVKLEIDFYYAVACYENGEMEEAKKAFENIIAFAPKMYLANVSQKYIEGIELSSPPVLSETKILPAKDSEILDSDTSAKLRRHRIVNIVVLIISAVVLLLLCFYNAQLGDNSDISTYETRLNNAISRAYKDAEAVTSFTLKTDANAYIDDICLINSGGTLDLVSVVTGYGGNQLSLEKLVTNIALDVPYCAYSPITNYYIGFQIYTDKSWDTDCYNVVEFEYNGQTCWLCVDYIGAAPRISASD